MISTIVTFLIILGVLVFIHEFGHFIVARLSGVGVLTFSLGFGPKLVSRKIGGTEYCISAVPLGGYVRLLGDDPKEEISPEEAHRSFLTQGFGKKVAIVAAGPIFNLLLAFVVFSIFFMVGVPSLSSDVGEVLENSAAARAGIRPDDRVAAINGKKVDYWDQIEEAVQKSNGRALQITVSRDGKEITTEVIPMVQEEKDIFGDPVKIWEVGLQPKVPAKIGSIQSGSPADSAGIKPGDQIIAVGDKKITQWQQIRDEIQASKGEEITLHVLRDGKQIELKITPKSADVQEPKGWMIGIYPKHPQVTRRFNPLTATVLGWQKTVKLTELNLKGILKLIEGKISTKTIGGPILIAQMTGQQASEGFQNVIQFLALLSLNLGIINLFPIPILDGGHLLIFGIEALIGRPLSMKIREVAQQIGLFIIITLMVYAMYNDLMRFIR
ncbi:MAG TPA: RIP metalloprotease RseP [Nitrospiria bacterium]|nr:RIP metalloprotease RseP [Nitrospiria bacterium]